MPHTDPVRAAAPAATHAARRMTAAELLHHHDPHDRPTELVHGRLVVHEPPGVEHARVTVVLAAELFNHVRARAAATGTAAGVVLAGDPGCWIERDPDTVRAPDVAYVEPDRAPAGPVHGFLPFAPTLAVEVRSPSDRDGAVEEKVAQWLAAGTALVWVVDPRRRTARVHRADGTHTDLAVGDALDGEAVLPGFVLPLAAVFG